MLSSDAVFIWRLRWRYFCNRSIYLPRSCIITPTLSTSLTFGITSEKASAAGFIDGWGYIGAAITGVGSGWLIDNFGWDYAFYFWVLGAVGAALLMTTIWNYGAIKGKYH